MSKAAAALALAVERGRPRLSRCMALFLADIVWGKRCARRCR